MQQDISQFGKTNNEAITTKYFGIGKHVPMNRVNPSDSGAISRITGRPTTYSRKDINEQEASKMIYDKKDLRMKDKQYKQIQGEYYDDGFKHRITRVLIDSRYRNKIPKNILSSNYVQLSNPFSFTKNSNVLTVNMPGHGFSINDKIIIDNVCGDEFRLKAFEFTNGSDYVKIFHKGHGMTPFDTSQVFTQYEIFIEGITNNDQTYINNVPLNLLNNKHTIIFNTIGDDSFDPDLYYIQLPLSVNIDTTTKNYEKSYKVIYRHVYGVPIYLINANYPITYDRYKGFHIVNEIISDDVFTILLDVVANNTVNSAGGDLINIDKVFSTIDGYPDANNYIIDLNKTFYHVVRIRLISSEIPNTDKTIRNYPENRRNNRFYWKIIDDGDNLYSIDITPGNYDVTSLVTEMKNRIAEVERQNTLQLEDTDTITYNRNLQADININTSTSIFDIKFFSSIIAENPFKIFQDTLVVTSNVYFMEVSHPNHLLQAGTQIYIQDSLDISFVPASVINNFHIIERVVNDNTYVIRLPKFNRLVTDDTTDTGGGLAVTIRYPLLAKLFFDKTDTVGKLLGFRRTGEFNAITEWGYTLTNNMAYENDVLLNSVGVAINTESLNNYINLNGDNYILMTNPLFKNTENIGTVSNVFAKLLLAGLPGYVLFDQFVQVGEELQEAIFSLKQLEFTFNTPDGELYLFNGVDHSFTIEIHEKIFENDQINNNTRNEPLKKGFHRDFELEVFEQTYGQDV